jgi:hypothetical protein
MPATSFHFVPLSSHEVEWHEVERWLYILMDRQPPLFSWLFILMDRQPPLFSQTATTMDDSHLFFHSHLSTGFPVTHHGLSAIDTKSAHGVPRHEVLGKRGFSRKRWLAFIEVRVSHLFSHGCRNQY